MTTLDEILRHGRAAAELLDNDVFLTAVEQTKDQIVESWLREEDADVREAWWFEQKALARVIHRLGVMIQEKDIAQAQLNDETFDPRLGHPLGAEHTTE